MSNVKTAHGYHESHLPTGLRPWELPHLSPRAGVGIIALGPDGKAVVCVEAGAGFRHVYHPELLLQVSNAASSSPCHSPAKKVSQ